MTERMRVIVADDERPARSYLTSLLRRLESGLVEEVIVATNPNVEGETTALYLSRLIKPLGIRVITTAGFGIGGQYGEGTLLK